MAFGWRSTAPPGTRKIKAAVALGYQAPAPTRVADRLTDDDARRIAEAVAAGLAGGIISVLMTAVWLFIALPILIFGVAPVLIFLIGGALDQAANAIPRATLDIGTGVAGLAVALWLGVRWLVKRR